MTRTRTSADANIQPGSAALQKGVAQALRSRARDRRSHEGGNDKPMGDASLPSAAYPTSKISQVIAMLRRDEGATLDEMVAATSWLPHSTRAALTGLKKKGHTLERSSRDGVTYYRIVEVV